MAQQRKVHSMSQSIWQLLSIFFIINNKIMRLSQWISHKATLPPTLPLYTCGSLWYSWFLRGWERCFGCIWGNNRLELSRSAYPNEGSNGPVIVGKESYRWFGHSTAVRVFTVLRKSWQSGKTAQIPWLSRCWKCASWRVECHPKQD